MSKNLATFFDVKHFTRTVEMTSGVLTDTTRWLFKKHRNHFFPANDFSWLNGSNISYCQLKSHAFYILTSQSIASLVHNYAVLQTFILKLTG